MTRTFAACAIACSCALAISTVYARPVADPPQAAAPAPPPAAGIKSETLLQTSNAWDGSTYVAYPEGKPQVSVLRITLPANTTMAWHKHPIPNVAYIVSGEIWVEKKDGGPKGHFTKGQTIAELVDVMHRGVTGSQPVELIVFYAGTPGLPLSQAQTAAAPSHP